MTKNTNNKYLISYCADPYYEELQIYQIENSSGVTLASQDAEDFKASIYFTIKKHNLEMKDLEIPNDHSIRYAYISVYDPTTKPINASQIPPELVNKWYFVELDAINALEAIALFRHYIYQRLNNHD